MTINNINNIHTLCNFLNQIGEIEISEAYSHPNKYLTIILDGMDQQKSAVPLLAKESKSAQVTIVL